MAARAQHISKQDMVHIIAGIFWDYLYELEVSPSETL